MYSVFKSEIQPVMLPTLFKSKTEEEKKKTNTKKSLCHFFFF